MPGAFEGRVALVTGATRGIGRAVAQKLGEAGAHVVAVGRTVGALEELDDAIQAAGGQAATLVPINLTDYDAIDRLGAAILSDALPAGILAALAGSLAAFLVLRQLYRRADRAVNSNSVDVIDVVEREIDALSADRTS